MIEDAKKNKPGRLYMPDSEVFLPRGRQMTLQHGSWMAPIFDAKSVLNQREWIPTVLTCLFFFFVSGFFSSSSTD